jgi:hypothetical protein
MQIEFVIERVIAGKTLQGCMIACSASRLRLRMRMIIGAACVPPRLRAARDVLRARPVTSSACKNDTSRPVQAVWNRPDLRVPIAGGQRDH